MEEKSASLSVLCANITGISLQTRQVDAQEAAHALRRCETHIHKREVELSGRGQLSLGSPATETGQGVLHFQIDPRGR